MTSTPNRSRPISIDNKGRDSVDHSELLVPDIVSENPDLFRSYYSILPGAVEGIDSEYSRVDVVVKPKASDKREKERKTFSPASDFQAVANVFGDYLGDKFQDFLTKEFSFTHLAIFYHCWGSCLSYKKINLTVTPSEVKFQGRNNGECKITAKCCLTKVKSSDDSQEVTLIENADNVPLAYIHIGATLALTADKKRVEPRFDYVQQNACEQAEKYLPELSPPNLPRRLKLMQQTAQLSASFFQAIEVLPDCKEKQTLLAKAEMFALFRSGWKNGVSLNFDELAAWFQGNCSPAELCDIFEKQRPITAQAREKFTQALANYRAEYFCYSIAQCIRTDNMSYYSQIAHEKAGINKLEKLLAVYQYKNERGIAEDLPRDTDTFTNLLHFVLNYPGNYDYFKIFDTLSTIAESCKDESNKREVLELQNVMTGKFAELSVATITKIFSDYPKIKQMVLGNEELRSALTERMVAATKPTYVQTWPWGFGWIGSICSAVSGKLIGFKECPAELGNIKTSQALAAVLNGNPDIKRMPKGSSSPVTLSPGRYPVRTDLPRATSPTPSIATTVTSDSTGDASPTRRDSYDQQENKASPAALTPTSSPQSVCSWSFAEQQLDYNTIALLKLLNDQNFSTGNLRKELLQNNFANRLNNFTHLPETFITGLFELGQKPQNHDKLMCVMPTLLGFLRERWGCAAEGSDAQKLLFSNIQELLPLVATMLPTSMTLAGFLRDQGFSQPQQKLLITADIYIKAIQRLVPKVKYNEENMQQLVAIINVLPTDAVLPPELLDIFKKMLAREEGHILKAALSKCNNVLLQFMANTASVCDESVCATPFGFFAARTAHDCSSDVKATDVFDDEPIKFEMD